MRLIRPGVPDEIQSSCARPLPRCPIATLVLSSGPPVSAGIDQPAVVSANPADFTPQIPLGDFSVLGLKQVGSTMYVGGRFSTLGGKSRTNVGAFSATTGV